jgi:hypothetical protein
LAESERMRRLLQERYRRYISSSGGLEFGASDTLMFEGMCDHYAAYAAKHRIPTYHDKTCSGGE